MGTAEVTFQARGISEEMPLLIGEHPVMDTLARVVRKVAPSDATVLLLGESGTGKDLVARAIHALSERAQAAFVPVNCGAIPAELLESEMFGHERGAFTGAAGPRAGVFPLAHGGTIFLDEVSEMSPALQVKLLRVLQDHEVRPVGSDRVLRVDVRVVAASNRNLAAELAAGRFREDLFYRLNVIPVTIPTLRERRSDIPLLVRHFLAQHNRGRRSPPLSLSDEAMVHLWEYDWPGNIRELENLVERLAVLADGPVIGVDDLPPGVRVLAMSRAATPVTLDDDGLDLNAAVDEFEQRLIAEALRRTKGNKQAAATLLGLKRTTLLAKLRRHVPDEPDVTSHDHENARRPAGDRRRRRRGDVRPADDPARPSRVCDAGGDERRALPRHPRARPGDAAPA
jgi:DNA-binding NtrC family response regulator